MTDIQENKHTRNKTTDSFLDTNAAIIAPIADFVTQASALKSKNAEVDALRTIQETNITGSAADKEAAEESAINNAMILVNIAKAKCAITGNHTLGAQFAFSKSSLDALRDTTLSTVLQNINTTANANLALFASSGMTAAMIAASTASTAAYTALVTAPRQKIDTRSAATQMIEQKLKEASVIIENIKTLGAQFQFTNPTFFNQLNGATEIINLGKNNPPPPTP